MYAQKYLMALKQNIAHTLKSYGYILSYVLQPAPIVKIWDGKMRIEMLHHNKKIMQFMHLNAEFSERRLIAQSLDLSINEMVIPND